MVLGGTLLELIVPFACAVYFFFQRQCFGTAFCSFWFFENFLYIGVYMSDAAEPRFLLSVATKATGPSSSLNGT